MVAQAFDDLISEGAAAPVDGWDFSWFRGRATEERPSWGYAVLAAERVADAQAALDVQTGGGEVFAWMLGRAQHRPLRLAATESWPPNLPIARAALRPFGAAVVQTADDGVLPFPADSFDLVISRHPVTTAWDEIARVLRPGGTYLSQQVGAGSNRELTDFMMGPQPVSPVRKAERAAQCAEDAGLLVMDLRQARLRTVFYDIGAVVCFLRKVIWTVPGFTVSAYRDQLRALHEQIQRDGCFVAHAQRFLIEARAPLDG